MQHNPRNCSLVLSPDPRLGRGNRQHYMAPPDLALPNRDLFNKYFINYFEYKHPGADGMLFNIDSFSSMRCFSYLRNTIFTKLRNDTLSAIFVHT